MISHSEVFTADEAATCFETYYQAGAIPDGYTLALPRVTVDGAIVDLRF